MRRLVSTAALTVLAGALWATAASAAAPAVPAPKLGPVPSILVDRTGHVVNFNLGGLMAPSLAQDFSALKPNTVSVTRGLQLDLGHGRNWDPYGDLFPAAASLNSTFLSGANTSGRATFALGRDVNLNVGHVALGVGALSAAQPSAFSRELAARLGANDTNIGTTTANLNWNFSDWGGMAITASRSNSNASLLSGGALRNAGPTESSALGISARVGFGEGWVTTLTYAEGVTQLDLSRDRLVTASDPVRSEAYGIGLAKKGLFGDDALGIALSRPLQIFTGSNSFGALNTNFPLANTHAQESDVALGYVTTFLDGTLALQANAAYQVNAAGTRGQNAVTGVARAKLNF